MLAIALATDTYKSVHILDDKDISTREFTRTRNTRKNELKKTKQYLLSFLLRLGKSHPNSGSHWTQKHWNWLETLDLQDSCLNYSLKSYIQDIKNLENKIQMMDSMIEQIATTDERYREKAGKLMCLSERQTGQNPEIIASLPM